MVVVVVVTSRHLLKVAVLKFVMKMTSDASSFFHDDSIMTTAPSVITIMS